MAQHDYIIDNANGLSFRNDVNNALSAVVTHNSGATAPTTTYAFQVWADTTNDLLKIRNAANSAWITIGTLSAINLGLAPIQNPSFTGTTGLVPPAGTTVERPGTPTTGIIRWNTTLTRWEGYNGTAWVGFTVA